MGVALNVVGADLFGSNSIMNHSISNVSVIFNFFLPLPIISDPKILQILGAFMHTYIHQF